MAEILFLSGWLGRNTRGWYESSGDLGDHIIGLADELTRRGHVVQFKGDRGGLRNSPACEVHVERQFSFNNCAKIAIYCEPHFVQPQNAVPLEPSYVYRFRMDTRTEYRDNDVRYYYPRELTANKNINWEHRNILVSSIASNKNAVLGSYYNLYVKRNELIHRFNSRFGDRFHLYGGGWDLRDHPVGLIAKVAFRLSWLKPLLTRPKPLASYRGKCDFKAEIMQRSKFTLCVENTQYPGCMTEKMIDCFRFGSVPLYLGPPDIGDMIDPSLFIDLRQFDDGEALFSFIENFSEADYRQWLERLELHRADIRARHSISGFVKMVSDAVEDVIARPVTV